MIVNAEVILESGQDAAQACKLLKRALVKAGVLAAMKRHETYRKPSQAKRIKSAKARRRARKDGYHLYEAKHMAYLDRAGLSDDPRRIAQSSRGFTARAVAHTRRVGSEATGTAGSNALPR